jgi:hypothetical protein
VNVPGLGKRNRLVIFDLHENLALIRKSIADECRAMLCPPVSLVGISAVEKLAREIARWPEELGEVTAAACLRQVQEYLNSPPDLAGDHLTAGRDRYITFLQEAGAMAGLDFRDAMRRLRQSMAIIPLLAEAIRQGYLEAAAAHISRIAQEEGEAYRELSQVVGVTDLALPR